MEIKTHRDEELKKVRIVIIHVGLDRYRINEHVDGKLTINKYSDGDSDDIHIRPKSSNEIELF